MPKPTPSVGEESLQDRIRRVVSDLTGVSVLELSDETLIRHDLRADSMQIMALMIALDAEFDVEFDVSQIPTHDVTLAWIYDFVQSTLASAG